MGEHSKGTGELERVLILWEDQDPGPDEMVDLIRVVAPGWDPALVHIEKVERPAISYGLAGWHVHQDEKAGRLRPGALRRTHHALLDDAGRGRRLVTTVHAPLGEAPEPSPARLEWAREVILRNVSTHELEVSPELMELGAWRRLITPDVLDFALNVGYPDWPPLDSGRTVGYSLRTFEDLKVIVSLVDEVKPRRVRKQFREGYQTYLRHVLHELDYGDGQSDVAHWILCQGGPGKGRAVHLGYVPKSPDSMIILPLDLISAKEKRLGVTSGA
ncbi:hypothetical protein ACFWM7_10980 [Streptomyces sp. NPDC058375]|uniref:hypothetical protein n=1 Tax=Streptomyces sp. NPDC058375 TaxID=3346467 RepID=UPI00364EF878